MARTQLGAGLKVAAKVLAEAMETKSIAEALVEIVGARHMSLCVTLLSSGLVSWDVAECVLMQ